MFFFKKIDEEACLYFCMKISLHLVARNRIHNETTTSCLATSGFEPMHLAVHCDALLRKNN